LLYTAYELQRSWLNTASTWASVGAQMLNNPALPFGYTGMGPVMASALEVFAHASAPYGKPAFDIETVSVDGAEYPVTEAIVVHRPFGNLLHFSHPGLPENAPRLLIVAPMSGHFATLLRGTVARMIERAHVFITDWADAKTVPLSAGEFDLDDYIDHVIGFLEHIGPGAHMLAVCQPSVPALAATAIMADTRNPCRPLSLTMMGGPVDTREAPTSVNDMAMQRPLEWFNHTVIATVPLQYPGAGRQVYPGFLQLAGFMSMNLGNHMLSHYHMFRHLVEGADENADATKAFYDEYRAPTISRPSSTCSRSTRCPRASSSTAARSSISARSRTPRCSRSKASATISPGSARPRRRCTSPPGLPNPRSSICSPLRLATTGSSTAASGASRSPRCWKPGSPSTTARR
jgi:poly(3-hydroxybutyrate) depolymerase